ncbi:hypothetical protein [Streptomyces sp. NPDC001292]
MIVDVLVEALGGCRHQTKVVFCGTRDEHEKEIKEVTDRKGLV